MRAACSLQQVGGCLLTQGSWWQHAGACTCGMHALLALARARVRPPAHAATRRFPGLDEYKEPLILFLLGLLALKAQHSCSEQCITGFLTLLSSTALFCGMARSTLPLNFKAMLAAISDLHGKLPTLMEYDMCPCGHLYR